MNISKNINNPYKFKRYIRAEIRYLKILLYEFKWTLIIFFFLLLFCSLWIYINYSNDKLGYLESLNLTLHLMFMDQPVEFPHSFSVQVLFILLPIFGFGIIAEGLIRFMVLLFNKKSKMEVWQMALASTLNNHIVVCGLGKVGYRVVMRLLKTNKDICVIESQNKNQFYKEIEEHNIPIIIGECQNKEILKQARIQNASALVLATDNDLVNLETALLAKEYNSQLRIVMRTFNPNLAGFIQKNMGFRTFSTSEIAAPALASAVFSDNIIHAIDIDGTEANIARFTVPKNSALIGKKIIDIEREYDITFILHQNRNSRDVHPAPDIIINENDTIIFLSPTETLMKIEKIL